MVERGFMRTGALAVIVGVVLLASGCSTAARRPETPEYGFSLKGTGRQVGRGLTNVALCWLEVPYHVEKQVGESPMGHPFDVIGSTLSGALGVVNGAIWGVGRGLGGVIEVVLSPFPPYEPLMKPAYPPYVGRAKESKPEAGESGGPCPHEHEGGDGDKAQ